MDAAEAESLFADSLAEPRAACIGGAAQQDNYRGPVAAAGLRVVAVQDNSAYAFISDNVKGVAKKFGVKSISLLAVKPS